MKYNPQELEKRWRGRWRREGSYDADPSDAASTFVTVAYPYPSGGMHIGHARTYTVPDVYARYRRQRGDNVLFPIAWHVTGTPIVGAVERLKKGEKQQLSVLQDTYHVPKETLDELETPMGFARYFIEEHYKKGMQQLGLSIDWRREFTTNDERYSKFITWQYETLQERGLLEKGLHPVKYCTNERNPVTTHDLLEGEEAEFQEYTLVKFEWESEGRRVIVPMATLRPETVRGVTNAFIDPEAKYVFATVDGEEWFISASAAEKFHLQERDVTVRDDVLGDRLVGEYVENPVTEEEVLVLPAGFVDPDNATGVVMSVPGHSPDDWVALQEAKIEEDRMRSFGIDPVTVAQIEPRSIIDVEGYGVYPAQDAVSAYDIVSSDDPNLKKATREVYNKEFHAGRLKEMYGEYAGELVEDVREQLRASFQSSGDFDTMYEFTEVVICRCGGAVEVANQETWFLRYSDSEWKEKARNAANRVDAIPENTREQYLHTIDWLNEWPCIRNYGLGTRLPWDPAFVIEPLSDSTIYMAYYTVAHRLSDIPVDELDRTFFDTLFFGSAAVTVPNETALKLRDEWEYWYPVDYRCSGNDLIANHLTFYLFHHAELFDEDQWPQGITVMGMGLLEGEAMSSSRGNVVLPGEVIERYGADTVRFFLLNSAEPWQDYDWRADQVESTRTQLERFWNRACEIIETNEKEPERPELSHEDRWLLAKLQETIHSASTALDRFETRTASQAVFYGFEEHLRWYRRRTELARPGAKWTVRTVLETRLRLLGPFTPFLSNELHEQLTGVSVEEAPWPEPDPEYESGRIHVEERLIKTLFEDIRDIVAITHADPDVIRVYVAADWKRAVFDAVMEVGPDVGAVMGNVMADEELRTRGNEVNQLVQRLVEVVRGQDTETLEFLADTDEHMVYDKAITFLEREFDATVEVYQEDHDAYDPAGKATNATPFRPAVHIE